MSARFSERDLDRWVERGLLSADQRAAILADLEDHPPDTGLNLTTLLYYGGGLLVLLAYGVFLGFQWEELNEAGRVVIAAVSLVFFAGVSQVLISSRGYRLPGELLQVVAVAVVPLLAFAVLDATGLWPDDPGFRAPLQEQDDYERDLTLARISVTGAAFLAALIAFGISRSPFAMAAAIVSVTLIFVDTSVLFDVDRADFDWDTPQLVVVALMGAVTFAAGVLVPSGGDRNYSLWLYVLGLVGLTIGLGGNAFPSEAAGWGLLWLILSLGVLALSLPLQERLLAAAGLAGVFAYLAKLVFDVFESANAALALAALGLLIVAAGVIYQRYQERLFSREGERTL